MTHQCSAVQWAVNGVLKELYSELYSGLLIGPVEGFGLWPRYFLLCLNVFVFKGYLWCRVVTQVTVKLDPSPLDHRSFPYLLHHYAQ